MIATAPSGNVEGMPFKCTKCMGKSKAVDPLLWQTQPRVIGATAYVAPVNLTDEPVVPRMRSLATPGDVKPEARTGVGVMSANTAATRVPTLKMFYRR